MKIFRYPSTHEFVLRYVAGSALASFVAAANDSARATLLADVNAELQRYVDHGLKFSIERNTVMARK